MKNKDPGPAIQPGDFMQPAGSTLLHNMGGPRSRSRSEQIRRFYPGKEECSGELLIAACPVPPEISGIEEWLLTVAAAAGLDGWEEVDRAIRLPEEKMILFPADDVVSGVEESSGENPAGFLRRALILARCNRNGYLPGGPVILTRSRLERNIRLMTLNTERFYELE